MVLSTKLLKRTTAEANEIEQERLHLLSNHGVTRIARIKLQDGRPLAYETIVLAAHLFPGIEQEGQAALDISALALQYGLVLGTAIERVIVVRASAVIARHLDLEIGAPILAQDRVTHTADGLPIEWRVRFQATTEL